MYSLSVQRERDASFVKPVRSLIKNTYNTVLCPAARTLQQGGANTDNDIEYTLLSGDKFGYCVSFVTYTNLSIVVVTM